MTKQSFVLKRRLRDHPTAVKELSAQRKSSFCMHQIDRDCSTQPLRDSTKSVEMFPEREFSDQNLVPIHLFTKSVEMCLKESVQTKTLLILWWLANSNFVHFGRLQNFAILEHRFFNLIAEFNFAIRISYFHQLLMVKFSGNVEFFEAMYQETKKI